MPGGGCLQGLSLSLPLSLSPSPAVGQTDFWRRLGGLCGLGSRFRSFSFPRAALAMWRRPVKIAEGTGAAAISVKLILNF